MKKDNRTNILFRYGIVVAAILSLSVYIVVKLVNTTVIDRENWNKKASAELNRIDTIQPTRGNILARDGSILATNLRFYTVRIDYRAEKFNTEKYRQAVDTIADSMAVFFPQKTRAEWHAHLMKPLEKPDSLRPRAYKIISQITNSDVQRLRTLPFFKIKNPNRNGFRAESYLKRYNPYGLMARRSIGGVGETKVSKEIHGWWGLERALDSLLFGRPGYGKMVNLTRKIASRTDVEPVRGCDVTTTIDIAMQDIVENELNNLLDTVEAEWGLAVLMDVHSGEIRAISNLERSDGRYIEALNRAVIRFEPGSVVKTLSMMIALEDGIVKDLNEVLTTGGGWAYAGGRPITDAHYTQSIRVGEVLEQSSNIGMARIITRKYDSDPKAFTERVAQTGFLSPMNTGMNVGSIPNFDPNPGRVALSRMSYGYATEIPPIYTLALYNAIANDGDFVTPHIVKEIHGEGVDSIVPIERMGPTGRACSPATAATLRQMLTNVVWGEHGTGKFLRNDLVKIAGKTGTCYMIENFKYNPSKKRLAFCGFFPADNPQFSCMVLTCHPKRKFFGAATTSGQVVKNIAMKLYSRGMLGDTPDYKAGVNNPKAPTFFASISGNAFGVTELLKMPAGKRVIHKPEMTGRPGVPDVRGLGIRDAVAALETAGYEVDFSGSGFVASQKPGPGTHLMEGTVVTLALSH